MTSKSYYPPSAGKQSGSAAGAAVPFSMGLIFIGIGIYIMLAGLGITSIGKILVDPWIVVVIGGVVALFGVALIFQIIFAPTVGTGRESTGRNLVILPEERPAKLVQSWVFSVIWNGLVGVFWYLILSGAEGEGDIWVAYVVLGIFTPIGLAVLYWSVKLTLSALRFGLIPLQLKPATAGSQRMLSASLQVPRKDVLTMISAKLICYTVRWTRVRKPKGGSSISQSRTENWSSGLQRIPVRPGSSMDISIAIPPYLPATTASLNAGFAGVELDTDYFAWMLEITADVPGVDLYRSYEVPVPEATPEMLSYLEKEPIRTAEQDLQKATAVRTVAEADFNAGRSAEEIADKFLRQGLSLSIIRAGMQQIADNTASPHRGQAQIWSAQQKKIQAEIDAGQLMMLNRSAKPRK